MSLWPYFFAVSLLCLSHFCVANNRSRQCRCISDQKNYNYGTFQCRSQDLPSVDFSSECIRTSTDCKNISIASLESNRLTEYPELLGDWRFKTINLSRNKLRSVPRDGQISPFVKYLDLSWNKITNSTQLENVARLKTLLISGNSLKSLSFVPDPCGLEELDVSCNSIATIDSSLRRCTGLSKLNLRKNRLTSLTRDAFAGLRYLETLNLGQNPLSSLADRTFISLSYLRGLSLTSAKISDLRKSIFTGLQRLEYLDLSKNNVDSVPSDVFRELPNISTLMLDDNQLSELPNHLLSNHSKLKYLSLKSNDFIDLPASIILEDRPTSLEIDLTDNRLQPRLLGWIFTMNDLLKNVDGEHCNCGHISRQNVRVRFCIMASCGSNMQNTNWMDLVMSVAENLDLLEDDVNNF